MRESKPRVHDGVGALADLLGQRHDWREVLAFVLANASAHAPARGQLVATFSSSALVSTPRSWILRSAFARHIHVLADRHAEHAAVVLQVRECGEARRRVARVQVLRVQRQAARLLSMKSPKPTLRSARYPPCLGVVEGERSSCRRSRSRRRPSRASSMTSPSLFALCTLNHEFAAHAQRDIGAEYAVAVAFIVVVRR